MGAPGGPLPGNLSALAPGNYAKTNVGGRTAQPSCRPLQASARCHALRCKSDNSSRCVFSHNRRRSIHQRAGSRGGRENRWKTDSSFTFEITSRPPGVNRSRHAKIDINHCSKIDFRDAGPLLAQPKPAHPDCGEHATPLPLRAAFAARWLPDFQRRCRDSDTPPEDLPNTERTLCPRPRCVLIGQRWAKRAPLPARRPESANARDAPPRGRPRRVR
jgi:hypothetical protein